MLGRWTVRVFLLMQAWIWACTGHKGRCWCVGLAVLLVAMMVMLRLVLLWR